MTDWTKEEDEAFNEVERLSNLGKQILRDRMNKSSGMDCCTYDCIQGRDCPVRKAKWQGLTQEEFIHFSSLCHFDVLGQIEKLLEKKNT